MCGLILFFLCIILPIGGVAMLAVGTVVGNYLAKFDNAKSI